ncbi:hypothetical protein BJ165DRAFT_1356810, partial [Panaeolus papilionaceus]
MVYTSPTKIARIVTLSRKGEHPDTIAPKFRIHQTTVTRILKRFEESGDFYYRKPKTGCPHKMSLRDAKCAARKLASGDVSNVTELQKKHYPDLGAQTLRRSLKKYGLICRV